MADISPSLDSMNDTEIAADAPLTEALFSKMAANINDLVNAILPVGSIVDSMLTEVQFNSQMESATWVIADGRSCSGTRYSTLTGASTVPDLRGGFRRSKNNGRSDGKQNPDGDLALGAYTDGRNANHRHGITLPVFALSSPTSGFIYDPENGGATPYSGQTSYDGGNDAAPKNVTVNSFIRVD